MSIEQEIALLTVSGPQALSLAAVVLTRAHGGEAQLAAQLQAGWPSKLD